MDQLYIDDIFYGDYISYLKRGHDHGITAAAGRGAERKDIFSYYRNKLGNIDIDTSAKADSRENTKDLEETPRKGNILKKYGRKCKDILRSLKGR